MKAAAAPRLLLFLACWGCLPAAGCGARPGAQERPQAPTVAFETIAGARLLMIPRATDGLVHLALYIDAGSRDAQPPQVATAIAWAASTDEVVGRVVPEGTVFEVDCEADEVPRCIETLAAVLARRSINDEELLASRRRLTTTRRRANAEEGRTADLLALEALLGEQARGFSPLGAASDDDAVTTQAITAFLQDHYGPRRALIVAAGDFDQDTLRDAIGTHLGESPAAQTVRAGAGLDVPDGVRSRVLVGDDTVVTGAFRTHDGQSAMAAAAALDDASQPHFGRRAEVSAYGFGIRAGGLVLVRISHLRPPRAVHRVVTALGRIALEAAEHDPPAEPAEPSGPSWSSGPSDPRIAARVVGSTWLAGNGSAPRPRGSPLPGIGIGVVASGGRGDNHLRGSDGSGLGDPDAALLARVEARVDEAVSQASMELAPELHGEVSDTSASLTLGHNGARIDVERRNDDVDVAIAVRFLGGGGADPATLHGRGAFLARLSTNACQGLRGAGLQERLHDISGTITSLVEGASSGVLVRGPMAHADELVDLALDCALAPSLRAVDLIEARLSSVRSVDPAAAAVGAALAPGAPGAIAPWGSIGTLENVGAPALRRELLASRVGARTAVAIVGNVAVEEVIGRVARRLARLEAGRAPAAPVLGEPNRAGPSAFEHSGEVPRVVIGFVAKDAHRPDAETARALARGLADELGRWPGIAPISADGGEIADATWATVTLDVTEASLEALPARLERVAPAASRRTEALRAEAHRQRRWQSAQPGHRARELSRIRLLGPPRSQPDPASLLAAPPVFSIGRPR